MSQADQHQLVSQNKLAWQCRRGMLELDMLLIPFLAEVYPALDVAAQADFRDLLTYTDQSLYDALVKREAIESDHQHAARHQAMIDRIVAFGIRRKPHRHAGKDSHEKNSDTE